MTDRSYLIEQACGDCIIRIGVWRPWKDDPGTIFVEVVSNRSATRWRRRLKNAWSVLRGRYDWTGFEVLTLPEAEGLITALTDGKSLAFPPDQS